MKEPKDWLKEDIDALIKNKIPESLKLEYKRSNALANTSKSKSDIAKDVSAFANSDGGTIIYGVSEVDNFPDEIDGGSDPGEITKEWIEQIINSWIQQRISGIHINQIKLGKTPERVIYVVSIPQSLQAPHMVDNKYFKRFNFMAVPMEDYEVRDISRRNSSPALNIHFNLAKSSLPGAEKGNWAIQVSISNESKEPAFYSVLNLLIDQRFNLISHTNFTKGGNGTIKKGEIFIGVNAYSLNMAIPGSMPIWKGVVFAVNPTPVEIDASKVKTGEPFYIGGSINSPGMLQRDNLYEFMKTDSGVSWGPLDEVVIYHPYIFGNEKYVNRD